MLQIPDVPALWVHGATAETLAEDPALVAELENIVTLWERHIVSVIDANMAKVRNSNLYSRDDRVTVYVFN